MIGRRRALATLALAGGAGVALPALACRSARPKQHAGYVTQINALFNAWWAHDYAGFQRPFEHPEREQPFDGAAIYAAHFKAQKPRLVGDMLFNGAMAVVQVVTPHEPDSVHGLGGDDATGDLFNVAFFPGLEEPVINTLRYIDFDVLADGEWKRPRR